MKKILFSLFCLLMLFFVGCGDKPNEEVVPETPTCASCGVEVSTQGELCTECKKVTLYKKYLGTWDAEDYGYVTGEINIGIECYYTIILAEDSVALDGQKFDFNPKTDVLFDEDMPSEYVLQPGTTTFYLNVNNNYYRVYDNLDGSVCFCFYYISPVDDALSYSPHDYLKKESSSGSDSGETSSLEGTYAFETASGSQRNGTLLLEDGNWSWSGSGNPAATSGTYSVNGNKITFNWTSYGYDVSETITVTTSGNTSTWTSDGVTFFSMLFNVVDSEITFTYSE